MLESFFEHPVNRLTGLKPKTNLALPKPPCYGAAASPQGLAVDVRHDRSGVPFPCTRIYFSWRGEFVKRITQPLIGIVAAAGMGIFGPACSWAASDPVVAAGATVSLEYTLTLPDKTKVDSNVGLAPVVFTQGSGHLVPGLEKAINGMKAGQAKRVEVPVDQAYGAYNPDAQIKVPRNKVPPTVKVGDVLTRPSDRKPLRILEITADSVVMDANHPLAGKDLIFDVKILKVEPAAGRP